MDVVVATLVAVVVISAAVVTSEADVTSAAVATLEEAADEGGAEALADASDCSCCVRYFFVRLLWNDAQAFEEQHLSLNIVYICSLMVHLKALINVVSDILIHARCSLYSTPIFCLNVAISN